MDESVKKCTDCLHFNTYKDGEMEAQFGENVCVDWSWVNECSINRKEFSETEPVQCKKFASRISS